jgi:putative peptidoglycan lipid II flippase
MTPFTSIEERSSAPVREERGVLFDTMTLSAAAVLAKLAGAAKSVVIAKSFGSGAALDHYLLAFLAPSLLADTFCGALVPVTVPRLIELEHREDRAASIAFYEQVLRRVLLYSALGTAGIALIASAALWLIPAWRAIGMLALSMLTILPLSAAANVWRAALNSRRRFGIPAIAVVLTPAAIILSVFIAGSGGSAWVLAVGTTIGAASELVLLGVAIRAEGFPLFPRAMQAAHKLDVFRREYAYLAVCAAVTGGSVLIGQAMAATLGIGSVSILNYGTRLAGVLMAIGPAALSVAVLPRFSEMAAEREWDTLRRSVARALAWATLAAGAMAVLFILSSELFVRWTLERGAFTAADTSAVATVQAWSLVQMPFVVGIAILIRVLAALKMNRVLLPISAGALVANLGLSYVLMKQLGVAGISLGASLAQAAMFGAMAWIVFARRELIEETC